MFVGEKNKTACDGQLNKFYQPMNMNKQCIKIKKKKNFRLNERMNEWNDTYHTDELSYFGI